MTIAQLIARSLKVADGIDARDRLRAVQARIKQVREGAQAAGKAAARGRAAVACAQEAAAVYGSLNEQVATFRADALRAGATTTELPRHLVDGRRRQQVAQLELADAQRAAGLLEQDEQAAQTVAVEAEVELRAAIDHVFQSEAAGLVGQLREHEGKAAAVRVLLGSFLTIRTMSDPPVAWGIQSVMLEPAHQPAISIAERARLPSGVPAWQDLRTRLLTDADAALGDGT